MNHESSISKLMKRNLSEMRFMNQIVANHPWFLNFSQFQIGSPSRRKNFSKHGAAQNTTIKVYIWVCVYFSCISVTIVELNLVLKFRCGNQSW